MRRILVCGGCFFNDKEFVFRHLSLNVNKDDIIINGGAHGADSLASEFAKLNGNKCFVFPALWNLYGLAAGPIRNQRMIDEGEPDFVIAFPGRNGTADMVRRAKFHKIKVISCE